MLNKKGNQIIEVEDEDLIDSSEDEDLSESISQQPQIPAWQQQPAWMPTEDIEFDDEDVPFEIEELPPKRIDYKNPDEALSYLDSISSKYPIILELISLIHDTYEQMILDEDEKAKIDLLANTTSKLLVLVNNPSTIQETDKQNTIECARTILKVLEEYTKGLSKASKDAFTKATTGKLQVQKQTIPEYKSKYYGTSLIFVRNRAIKLIKDEGIDIEEGKKKAQEEWDYISKVIDIKANDKTDQQKEQFKTMFAQQVLGGTPLLDAEKFITDYINIGTSHENIFQNVEAEPDEWQDLIGYLTDKEIIISRLSEIPDDQREDLAQKIFTFGTLSSEIGEITKNLIEGIVLQPQDIEKIQDLYEKIIALGQQILTINPEYLKSDEIFEWVYIVFQNMEAIVGAIGIDTLTFADTSGAALAASNLNIHTNTRTKRDKALGEKPRERDPEVEEKARQAYIERIKSQDNYKKYLDAQLERRNAKRPEEETERRRIKTRFWSHTNNSKVKWNSLAHNLEVSSSDIQNLNKVFALDVLDLFKKMKQSWLSKIDLDKIESELLQHRLVGHTKLLEGLKKDKTANSRVISALNEHIKIIPKFFEQAAAQVDGMDIPKLKHTKKIASILNITNLYLENIFN